MNKSALDLAHVRAVLLLMEVRKKYMRDFGEKYGNLYGVEGREPGLDSGENLRRPEDVPTPLRG